MKSLFDILCCPRCKSDVLRDGERLVCQSCRQEYPIVNGTPIMFPDGGNPEIQHETELVSLGTYYPWIHRMVMQSLLDDQVVIEIGAGQCAVDDPCIIKTDVRWTPHIDVVCDAHALPFRSESAAFIFSLAVFEHLRQPFEAAQEIRRVLKDGGYCYHECNFVFAYHGYPHHYFNASIQGMEQVFSNYVPLRKGLAPYQMPSFALQMIMVTYLRHVRNVDEPELTAFKKKMELLVNEPMIDFDAYFTEEDAAYVAAGSYFFGMRQDHPDSCILPRTLIEIWKSDPELQTQIPDWRDLGKSNNLLLWARGIGRSKPVVEEVFAAIEPFQKRPGVTLGRHVVRSFPVTEPKYGTLWDFPEAAPPRPARRVEDTAIAPLPNDPSGDISSALQGNAGLVTRLRRAWNAFRV